MAQEAAAGGQSMKLVRRVLGLAYIQKNVLFHYDLFSIQKVQLQQL